MASYRGAWTLAAVAIAHRTACVVRGGVPLAAHVSPAAANYLQGEADSGVYHEPPSSQAVGWVADALYEVPRPPLSRDARRGRVRGSCSR
ncbi:hypothetical protein PF005_g14161 [Phytophthora fragariae]|uniref:Uncharacterized protein n=1 Tax=Phytophthora fragariae TaxID=53985 RepID=A0A6A3XJ70_9STRA|nr:hypothetical protein PF003_g20269 [Phytophthora fragariae]KAE8934613.1 hypothetical protein PF009_g15407 [Phytophthora fragariae]KAE9002700.1 hypothetical protein PF011_g13197 [Phytophthora fragariae]KAE9103338.1 hypothetical protein PF007_g14436 [Phytophthora fragariae]KAE9141276.1 hypothetical protein PF006_g13252 [Phytophthora fragariae]